MRSLNAVGRKGTATMRDGEQADAEQTGSRLGADRHQQAGEDEQVAEGLHAPVGREDRAVAGEPQDQRDHADRDGGDDAALEQAGIIPARDDDRRDREQHEQQQCFDSQLGTQGEGEEDGESQRLPYPVPFIGRVDRKIRARRRPVAIGEQRQHQPLARGDTRVLLVVEGKPGEDSERHRHRRDREGVEQEIAHPLGRDDVDIDIRQDEQERPAEAKAEDRRQERDKG
ncbi:hypothetical protein DdX_20967 [Ditylenchus destructor]|uniref:Uncharacterized protein n=1 Tax=Ditylenchus destructor TaxID=166010 RepID=A0AAD4MHZ1_9BILA|nr:hypothetical protein DdX_20967 [Ditylenchus destructor]